MSLQVWLPLNVDLRNNGVCSTTITNSGATVDDNGKIGKCYKFGTSNSYLRISNDGIKKCTTECTISFWVNIISWNTNYATFFQAGKNNYAWTDYVFGVLRDAGNSRLCFTIYDGSNYSGSSFYTSNLSLNIWYHLTFVYKSGHCLIYIDGSLDKDYTTNIVPAFNLITRTTIGKSNTDSQYQTNCKMNDFRIYDHALSEKEIKLLSQGLILHYPLNGFGGQSNLYDFESVANKWTVDGATLSNYTDSIYGNVLKVRSSNASYKRIYRSTQNIWTSIGKTFTVSFLAKASQNGAVCNMSRSVADFTDNFSLTTEWKRYIGQITTTATSDSGTLSFQVLTTGVDYYITQIKLEEGNKATVYIPGIGDSNYNRLGYNSTTEYDTSGNKYNGTKNGTLSYNTDSARYSVSTVFNGTNSYIEASESFCTGVLSYSFWVKTTTIPSTTQIIFGETSSNLAIGFYNSQIICSMGDSSIATGTAVLSNTSYTANQWNHIVVVKTGTTTRNLYVNGTLATLSSSNRWNGGKAQLIIGCRYNSGYGGYFDGQLSDFRAYATALSADDILELYRTGASVANNGTLLSNEFIEG